MKSLITTTLLIVFSIATCFSQHSIKGKITDQNQEPIPFANIILKTKDSKTTPKGAVSNENGEYIFENIKSGTYQLETSVLGFQTKKTKEFKLNNNQTFNFVLKEESQTLNEVVIKAKRPVIRQTAEKLIVDLTKSDLPTASLQDVMRRVPGVLVTNDRISVAGKADVRILINGKTTEYMDINTLLRDLPSDDIAKVEVVEQPGAEYDASGSGAIINIILKKNVRLGTHGSVTGWIGEDEGFEFGTRASIASYKNKLNWQTSFGYSQPTWRDDLFLVRTVNVNNTTETYDQTTRSPFDPTNIYGSASIDYFINDKNSFGVNGRWRKRLSDRVSSSTNIITSSTENNSILTETSTDLDRVTFNINPYYEYKSETEKLLVDYNYINFKNNTTTNIIDIRSTLLTPNDNLRYFQNGKFTINTFKADYSKNLSDDLKISFGSKYSMVKTDNDLQAFTNSTGNYVKDINGSSRFFIDESIFAIYSKVNTTFGDWSLSGGLRYEDSHTKGTSNFIKNNAPTTETKERPISKLFPSLAISKKISENLGANIAYSYRIQRPSYGSLNAFQTFLDRFSGEEGNPNLKPSFTNNYQFNLTYDGQPFFTVGYSQTKDAIFDQIKQTGNQIRQKAVNVEDFTNWNFRLFAPLSFIKKLDGYTGFIVTNPSYTSKAHGINLSKWNLYWFIQANYQLPWEIDFQLSANYGTGALEGQIEVDWIADLDFSFSKKFMNDRLKTSLGISKVLNRGFNGTIDYGNGNAVVESNGSRQNIQFRVTYSFGSKFGKKKSRRNASKEEEDRINDNN
ncbi:TonB-dependent receptor [Tenacibaculum holothuriorum]|uniref:TonB-dependent receptor n=1 Tax=Tenacibaculum holothuriorum TaxID=1635173 RepID=A0A1Y2PDV9_9FLAO|nr:TonB-dependent receptor [Tenacibaculum holothuriorum]OSY88625.1 TonB-dependent receptor [Tenacibaculum holothuriorum]